MIMCALDYFVSSALRLMMLRYPTGMDRKRHGQEKARKGQERKRKALVPWRSLAGKTYRLDRYCISLLETWNAGATSEDPETCLTA